MKRRLTAALLSLVLALPCAVLGEGDDYLTPPDAAPQETPAPEPTLLPETSYAPEEVEEPAASDEAEVGDDQAASYAESNVLPDGSVLVTITATGDVTIGGDTRKKTTSIFDKELAARGGDLTFPFSNVRDIFEADDLTIVNFEGTLTNTKSATNNTYSFAAPPEYVQVLSSSSVEAVSLENNHVMDHGTQGYADTCAALDEAGILYSGHLGSSIFTTDTGVRIGMLAYQTFNGLYPTIYENMPKDIAALREEGCDLVIVSYHWGEEKDYVPNERQVPLGRATIDAGADLVIGHHSHRMNPIELYNGKYICYSLGNFSFAGNTRPDDMDTYIFQQRFRITPEGDVLSDGIRIIPCSISSETNRNDFTPTPFTEASDIERVTEKLVQLGQDARSPSLEYALSSYPTAFEAN